MDLDQAALYAFLGLLVGGVFTFAREQIKWYQENYPKLEAILAKQQDTLEKMHADGQTRDDALRSLLEERLPKRDAPYGGGVQ